MARSALMALLPWWWRSDGALTLCLSFCCLLLLGAGELSDEALAALGFIQDEKTYGSPPGHPVMQQQMQVGEGAEERGDMRGGCRGVAKWKLC